MKNNNDNSESSSDLVIMKDDLPAASNGVLLPAKRLSASESPSVKYLLSLQSDKSKETMASHLNKVAGYFGFSSHIDFAWEGLTADIVYWVRGKFLSEGLSPSTINAALIAIKQTTKKAFINRQMSHEEYERIRLVERVRGQRVRSMRELPDSEIESFLGACNDGTYKGLRDAAIFLLVIGCGLRRSELVNIKRKDVNLDTRELKITGKGNKERLNWIPKLAVAYLVEYLTEFRTDISGEDYLFIRFFKNDDIPSKPIVDKDGQEKVMKLSSSSINYIFEVRGKIKALAKFKPHDLRGSYATKLLRKGKEIALVSRLLGHSSIQTTRTYDLRPEIEAKEIALNHDIIG